MAYTDDAVLAKLSALNETQESIVTVAQWVMFHRRHADRTGQLWLQRLKDSNSHKRLNLIYLANEVAQQSKARKKDDFLIAFSPVIAEATATAYKGSSHDIQQKLRRVVEVWRQRQIFEQPIQEAIEARIEELDKARGGGKRGLIDGGSIFSRGTGSTPAELTPLVAPQQTVSKLTLSTKTALNGANQEYEKLTDPATPTPSAPVYAARLNGLLKTLANAEGAVAESIKARQQLIEGLEKILSTNKSDLENDQTQLAEVTRRKDEIDAKKREVEDGIMRGLISTGDANSPATPGQQQSPTTPGQEPDRPEVEALTPPAVEPLSPIEPAADINIRAHDANEDVSADAAAQFFPSPDYPQASAGADLLSTLATLSSYGGGNANLVLNGNAGAAGLDEPLSKKRKLADDVGEFPDLGEDDIDDDVAALLAEARE